MKPLLLIIVFTTAFANASFFQTCQIEAKVTGKYADVIPMSGTVTNIKNSPFLIELSIVGVNGGKFITSKCVQLVKKEILIVDQQLFDDFDLNKTYPFVYDYSDGLTPTGVVSSRSFTPK